MNTMTYKGYTARMDYDPEDKILVGRVLDIDDIVTFHGASVAEFEKAFHKAVDGYVAACEKLKQAPEKPSSGRLMLRVAPSVHAAALKSAAKSGMSLNKWAAKVLADAAHRTHARRQGTGDQR